MDDPKVIGPPFWMSMSFFAVNADTVEKRDIFKKFAYLLTIIFPCSDCRTNLIKELKNLPINNYIKTPINLGEWTWILHNRVNKRLRKPIFTKIEFNKTYYLEKDGIDEDYTLIPNNDPDVIGPFVWKMIHYCCANADTQKKRNSIIMMMHYLTIIFPCPICRTNLVKELKNLPVKQYIKTSVQLTEWSWILHNNVNKRLEKSLFSKEELLKTYYSNEECVDCTIG